MSKEKASNNYLANMIALAAVIISITNYYASVRDSRTDLYISFKKMFYELRTTAPPDRKDGFKEDGKHLKK